MLTLVCSKIHHSLKYVLDVFTILSAILLLKLVKMG